MYRFEVCVPLSKLHGAIRANVEFSLAYSELFVCFAHIFRVLDMELYNTTIDDLEWGDYFAPLTNGHLKVKVRGKF